MVSAVEAGGESAVGAASAVVPREQEDPSSHYTEEKITSTTSSNTNSNLKPVLPLAKLQDQDHGEKII